VKEMGEGTVLKENIAVLQLQRSSMACCEAVADVADVADVAAAGHQLRTWPVCPTTVSLLP
jgi:hypothetical protein